MTLLQKAYDPAEFGAELIILKKIAQSIINPDLGHSPTWPEIAQEQWYNEATKYNLFNTTEEAEQALQTVPVDPGGFSWTDVNNGLKEGFFTLPSAISTLGLFEEGFGTYLQQQNPSIANILKADSGINDAAGNFMLVAKYALDPSAFAAAVSELPLGVAGPLLQGFSGGFTYVVSVYRLLTDPALDPKAGQNATINRVGVAFAGIGGALLVAGVILTPLGGPLWLGPVGFGFLGAGAVMTHWTEISSAFSNGFTAWQGIFQTSGQILQKLQGYIANRVGNGIQQNILPPAQAALNNLTTFVQQKVIQPAQKVLNNVTTFVQQKVIQPAQAALNNLTTFVQQKVIQPAQKVLNNVTTFVQQKVIQPAQKVLSKVNTTVQQKVIQPAQKVLNKVNTTVQQKVIQPAQKALNKVNTTVQQKVIQPAQKVLNKVNTTVQQKVIQPAQKVLNKVNTTVQQKVVQPAQKVLNKVNTTVQQKVIQPVQKAWNSLASAVKNIGKPASTPKSTPSTPAQKISARRR